MKTIKTIIKNIIDFIKKYYIYFLTGIFALMCLCIIGLWHQTNTQKKHIEKLVKTEKSLMNELAGNQSKIIEMEMSMNTITYYSDSIFNKLLSAKQEMGLKDKQIKNMQYMLSKYSKKDTLLLYDTIFCDPEFVFDTLLGDSIWMNIVLHLEYPNILYADYSARSEKEVFITDRKETVDSPKKFFLFRWLQKKQVVTTVDIHEENPYIISSQSRFVKISK